VAVHAAAAGTFAGEAVHNIDICYFEGAVHRCSRCRHRVYSYICSDSSGGCRAGRGCQWHHPNPEGLLLPVAVHAAAAAGTFGGEAV
jgi:hypothetical protein